MELTWWRKKQVHKIDGCLFNRLVGVFSLPLLVLSVLLPVARKQIEKVKTFLCFVAIFLYDLNLNDLKCQMKKVPDIVWIYLKYPPGRRKRKLLFLLLFLSGR